MSPALEGVIVMPAWNGATLITDALRSVDQAVRRHEAAGGGPVAVVVVDDASTDDTVTTVARLAEELSVRIELIQHERNRGTGAARNTGVAALAAESYLFLDQDDEFLPDHVHLCLEAMQVDPRAAYARTEVLLDRPVHPHWQASIAATLTQTLCVRRIAHRLIGGFIEDEAVATVGSCDLYYARLLRRFTRGTHVPAVTVWYRHRDGNAFDRQLARKFTRPPEQAESTLSGARLAAAPAAEAAFVRRMRWVEQRTTALRCVVGASRFDATSTME